MIIMKKIMFLLIIVLLILPINIEAKTLADMRKELKNLQTKLEESRNQAKLNKDEIKIESIKKLSGEIKYEDDYQVVISTKHKIFESKFEELYLKIINEHCRE